MCRRPDRRPERASSTNLYDRRQLNQLTYLFRSPISDSNPVKEYIVTNMQMFRGVLFVCFAAGVAFGQSNQASISGVVSDSQGAVIPGAKVTITNLATDIPSSAVTNQAGFYSIPNLPVGAYTLEV
jgi:hypothetical protein